MYQIQKLFSSPTPELFSSLEENESNKSTPSTNKAVRNTFKQETSSYLKHLPSSFVGENLSTSTSNLHHRINTSRDKFLATTPTSNHSIRPVTASIQPIDLPSASRNFTDLVSNYQKMRVEETMYSTHALATVLHKVEMPIHFVLSTTGTGIKKTVHAVCHINPTTEKGCEKIADLTVQGVSAVGRAVQKGVHTVCHVHPLTEEGCKKISHVANASVALAKTVVERHYHYQNVTLPNLVKPLGVPKELATRYVQESTYATFTLGLAAAPIKLIKSKKLLPVSEKAAQATSSKIVEELASTKIAEEIASTATVEEFTSTKIVEELASKVNKAYQQTSKWLEDPHNIPAYVIVEQEARELGSYLPSYTNKNILAAQAETWKEAIESQLGRKIPGEVKKVFSENHGFHSATVVQLDNFIVKDTIRLAPTIREFAGSQILKPLELNHSIVGEIKVIGKYGNRSFIVRDFIPGSTLHELLKKTGAQDLNSPLRAKALRKLLKASHIMGKSLGELQEKTLAFHPDSQKHIEGMKSWILDRLYALEPDSRESMAKKFASQMTTAIEKIEKNPGPLSLGFSDIHTHQFVFSKGKMAIIDMERIPLTMSVAKFPTTFPLSERDVFARLFHGGSSLGLSEKEVLQCKTVFLQGWASEFKQLEKIQGSSDFFKIMDEIETAWIQARLKSKS